MKRFSSLGRLAAWIAMAGLVANPVAEASVYVPATRLWSGGVVPFEWDPDMTIANRLRVIAAMNIWLDVANLEFVPRTDETDYVLIQNAPGDTGSRSPKIGREGGKQDLFIRQDLSNITNWGLAHELGHVLGFYHTQQRPDRDTYLTWYEDRTDPSKTGNFEVVSSALAYPRNAMDYDSVMSYSRCTFSLCEDCSENLEDCRVLEIKDPVAAAEFDASMGQRSMPGTPAADIYALGKVLYEACMGRDRQHFPEVPTTVWDQPEEGLLRQLNAVIGKACDTSSDPGYRSAGDLHAALLKLQPAHGK